MFMCIQVHTCTSVCGGVADANFGCYFSVVVHLMVLRWGFSLGPGACQLDRQGCLSSESWEAATVFFHKARTVWIFYHTYLLMWVLGFELRPFGSCSKHKWVISLVPRHLAQFFKVNSILKISPGDVNLCICTTASWRRNDNILRNCSKKMELMLILGYLKMHICSTRVGA